MKVAARRPIWPAASAMPACWRAAAWRPEVPSMCIGTPMQIQTLAGPGMAVVTGPEGPATVDIRLVGTVEPGQWLLVFLGAARECLSPERAAEIQAALGLLAQAMDGRAGMAGAADPGFALPSAMSAADLAALTGAGK
jgi:hydrogenase expression/formation protein HypC